MNEKEEVLQSTESNMKHLAMEADRQIIRAHQDHQRQIQQLLQQISALQTQIQHMRNQSGKSETHNESRVTEKSHQSGDLGESLRASTDRIESELHSLRQDNMYYKELNKELKRKLRVKLKESEVDDTELHKLRNQNEDLKAELANLKVCLYPLLCHCREIFVGVSV